jgi:hypothetical protein
MIWEGVAAAVLLAVVGGLATLAYRHPSGYVRVHEFLWRTLFVVFILYSIFQIGVAVGTSNMWEFIAADKFEAARAAKWSLGWSFLYPLLIFIASVLYLGFLRYLPRLVGRDDEYQPEAGILIPTVRGYEKKGESNRKKRRPSDRPSPR